MDIVFEEPSEAALLRHQGKGGKYVDWAIELRKHEGKWAVLPDEVPRTEKSASGTAQNIRRGAMKGFAKGEYDAVADGVKVHVKFTGAKESESAATKESGGEPGSDPGDPAGPPAEDDEDSDLQLPPVRELRSPQETPPGTIRAWARTNGFNVPAHGRLPDNVRQAYERRHGGEFVPGY